MRGSGWALVAASVLVVSGVASEASAHAIYKPAIPNADVYNCDTCHLPGDPNAGRNAFGQTVEPLAAANTPLDQWWDQVKELDSDDDGQTNAQELGDPCLEWTKAVPAGRTEDISNPGDPLSLALSPDLCENPPPMGEGGGGVGGGGTGMGNGDGTGMGNGDGTGLGNGDGMGGAAPEPSNGEHIPSDPQFESAVPSGCASIAGRSGDAGWLALAMLALAVARRRR